MTTPNTRIKFTYEDYKNTPEDKRYELINGELILVPSPKEQHQRSSMQLSMRLAQFVETSGLGRVYVSPFDVVFSDTDVVQPDILFISNERSGIITSDNVQGAPDLVIEILSPSTAERDRTYKRSLYARHGVREYWLVDTDTKSIDVLTLGEQGLQIVASYTQGQSLTSPILEGLSLNLDDIF